MSIIRSHEGRYLQVLRDTVCIKLNPDQSAHPLTVLTVVVPPASVVAPHVHLQDEETYFLLSGTLVMLVENQAIPIEPGDLVHIPPGTAHGYRNLSGRPARLLVWVLGRPMTPFFVDVAREVRTIPEDLVKLPEILQAYGIEMAEPNLGAAVATISP